MERILPFLILAYSLWAPLHGQSDNHDVIIGQYRSFDSDMLREKFTYLEHLPDSYDKSEKKYPVVFVLNSHQVDTFANAVSTVERLSVERIPEIIIIGISNTGRAAEYLPVQPNTKNPGGAELFQKFLEQELIPHIDKNYRTEKFRIMAGQSNSGLFTLYSLATRPQIFNAYIAASPSLGWSPEFMYDTFLALFDREKIPKTFVYMNYGELDYPELVNDHIGRLIQILKEKAPPRVRWEIEFLKNEGHVAVSSLNNGLLALFSGFLFPEAQREEGLEAAMTHYRNLSLEYGFDIEPPEEVLFNIAYKKRQAKKYEEAMAAFKTLLNIYPYSWRGHFFIGEVFRDTGNLDSAKVHYLKALEINPGLEAAKKRLAKIEKW